MGHFAHTFWLLIQKEGRIEWRNKTTVQGLLLYLAGTLFICYLSLRLKSQGMHPTTYNALFWIILLFTAINTVGKSFIQEQEGLRMYYFTLFSPIQYILSKILYNALLMSGISLTAWGMYVLIMGNPVQDQLLFGTGVVLGALGFSTTLTLMSALAAQTRQAGGIMPILSFPVIIPLLLVVMKVSKAGIDGLGFDSSWEEIGILLLLNIIVVFLSILLFPLVWKN